MDNLLINNVTRDNYKKVLQKLEDMGVMWRSGDKPTERPIFSESYTVGYFEKGLLTMGPAPGFKPSMSAEEFLRKYAHKIVITRKGRKVTATDQDGNHASARCCPEDNFDFYEGARLALERLEDKVRGIKEGDYVKVTDPGKTFSTLPTAYFTTNDELRRYVYGMEPKAGVRYKVKRVGHDGKLYIDGSDYSGLYVIAPEGVERVKK